MFLQITKFHSFVWLTTICVCVCVCVCVYTHTYMASQVALVVENAPANTGDTRDAVSTPGSGRSPRVENSTPLQYSCLENSKIPGQRNLVGYSQWGLKESNTIEWLNTHTHTHTHTCHIFFLKFFKKIFIYLVALSLSYSMWNLFVVYATSLCIHLLMGT